MNLPGINKPAIAAGESMQSPAKVEEVKLTPEQKVDDALRLKAAAQVGINADSGKTWSSHPVKNFRIGKFKFENSVMTLTQEEDIDAFEKLLAAIPAPDRVLIKEIDVDAAGKIAADHASVATKQFDSSVGRAAMARLKSDSPTVGTEDIEKAAAQPAATEQTQA